MNKEEREELFELLAKREEVLINRAATEVKQRVLTVFETTEDTLRKVFSEESKMLNDKFGILEKKLDNLQTDFSEMRSEFTNMKSTRERQENTLNFIKDFLLNNLVPRIEKLEEGYQYLLKLVTSKQDERA